MSLPLWCKIFCLIVYVFTFYIIQRFSCSGYPEEITYYTRAELTSDRDTRMNLVSASFNSGKLWTQQILCWSILLANLIGKGIKMVTS